MRVNISADGSRGYKIGDKDLLNSLPVGSEIDKIRLVKFRSGTEYERLSLLVDFHFDFDADISPDRTMEVVLRYNDGYKGNIINSCARMDESLEKVSDVKMAPYIECGAIVKGIRFRGYLHQECIWIDYEAYDLKNVFVIVLGDPDDFPDLLVSKYEVKLFKVRVSRREDLSESDMDAEDLEQEVEDIYFYDTITAEKAIDELFQEVPINLPENYNIYSERAC